ncbi:hypothetical protein D3C76_1591330 [compost metagenome]
MIDGVTLEHQVPQLQEATFLPPPEPAAVHLMIRSPEDGNAGVIQFFQGKCRFVEISQQGCVLGCTWRYIFGKISFAEVHRDI